jgi:hypothetical protein
MAPPPETPPDDAIHAGNHRVYFEQPDVFFIVANGDISVSDVLRIHEAIAAFEEDKEYIFVLMDASRLGAMEPGARKVGTRPEASRRMRGLVVFSASFTQRIVIMLIAKAFALLKKDDRLAIGSFETEAEARAWIDERRRAILAGK